MYMGLQKILLIRIVKVIVPVLFVMGLFGCAYNEAKDKLIDHYQDIIFQCKTIMMRNNCQHLLANILK